MARPKDQNSCYAKISNLNWKAYHAHYKKHIHDFLVHFDVCIVSFDYKKVILASA